MKILTLNCSPDFSWLTNRGLKLEIENKTIPLFFALKFLYPVKDSNGAMVDLYTPDVALYLEQTYYNSNYDVIMVGWNPTNYDNRVSHTGGYTCPDKLSFGARWITVRQDTPANNIYPVHELMHAICDKINIDFGDRTPKDFMDVTPVNGVWISFYENDYKITDPLSNFNQTWKNILPFLDQLNGGKAHNDPSYQYDTKTGMINSLYKAHVAPQTNINPIPVVSIIRDSDDGIQTLGTLTFGSFSCKTLERPWKQNQHNISCIPTGTYQCSYTFSLGHLGWTYEVNNIPGRSGIRIHSANFYLDLEGCIALGSGYANLNSDQELDIINSRLTINNFVTLLNKKDFTLIIK